MNISTTQDLRQAIRNPYAWPGGYPTYIILYDGEYLCHECARENYKALSNALRHRIDDGWRPVAHEVYWKGPPEQCVHCNKSLESAYGDLDE
jgi:hypothetical protein